MDSLLRAYCRCAHRLNRVAASSPSYARTPPQRWVLVLVLETTFLQAIKDDGKGARARFASVSRNYITKGAPPQYHSLLLPAPGELEVACKRRIFDAGYIPSLNRENVELTNDQAVRINEWSVTLRSGKEVKADVILLANGFQADKFALQMEIKGRKGRTLEQYVSKRQGEAGRIDCCAHLTRSRFFQWKQAGVPQAYRGTFISGFPNYFVIWCATSA